MLVFERMHQPDASYPSNIERTKPVPSNTADQLEAYAEGVQENLLADEPQHEGTVPVVEDYRADAARIRAGEQPIHEHTLEVLAELEEQA